MYKYIYIYTHIYCILGPYPVYLKPCWHSFIHHHPPQAAHTHLFLLLSLTDSVTSALTGAIALKTQLRVHSENWPAFMCNRSEPGNRQTVTHVSLDTCAAFPNSLQQQQQPVRQGSSPPPHNIRQMTSFYDDKELEAELSEVTYPDEDLEFDYLFEYEPPCSDFAAGDQGLSEAFVLVLDALSSVCSACLSVVS